MSKPLPLGDAHAALGARSGDLAGYAVPLTYGDPEAEYHAASRGVAIADRSFVGRLRARGADSLDLLNRLTANLTDPMLLASGVATVLTSPKGRVVDLLTVYVRKDHQHVVTSPGNQQAVLAWLEQYTFSEDAQFKDTTDELFYFSLYGPKSHALVRELVGEDISTLPMYASASFPLGPGTPPFLRGDALAPAEYSILGRASDARAYWDLILDRGKALGGRPIGVDTQETLRIEAGYGALHKEFDERYNPLEANLRFAVSFDKGCYTGQEVVARLDTYQKVQRLVVGMAFPPGATISEGDALTVDGQEAGHITSATVSPALGRPIALGYVRSQYVKVGQAVHARHAGEVVPGEIVELPFVR